jgi:calcium-dependent protein kinase
MLGRGAYAEVWRVKHRGSKRDYACKSISKALIQKHGNGGLNAVSCEIENHLAVLNSISSPTARSSVAGTGGILSNAARSNAGSGVVAFHMVVEDATHIHLIMDVCEGGSLLQKVAKNGKVGDAVQSRDTVKAVANSINTCHTESVAHRDIKPENFAYVSADCAPESLRLLDFGLSRSFKGGKPIQYRAGSPHYVAPEVLSNGPYDQQCDAWSLGVLSFFTLTGQVPFQGSNMENIFDNIQNSSVPAAPLQDSKLCSDAARDFVSRLLVKDAAGRMTVGEALKHDWMSESLATMRA